MRILAIEKEVPGAQPEQIKPLLKEEAKQVWRLYQQEYLREIWFTVPDRRAVLLLECNFKDQALTLLQALPLVSSGYITFELLVLGPYDGFERLLPRCSESSPIRNILRRHN